MSKYTPGPWWRPKTDGETIIVGGEYADMGEPDMVVKVESYDEETEKANARLIAAVPELLEVLDEIVKTWGSLVLSSSDPVDMEFDSVAVMAKAALAKARGEANHDNS